MAAAKVSSAQLMKRTKGAGEVEERHHYKKKNQHKIRRKERQSDFNTVNIPKMLKQGEAKGYLNSAGSKTRQKQGKARQGKRKIMAGHVQ